MSSPAGTLQIIRHRPEPRTNETVFLPKHLFMLQFVAVKCVEFETSSDPDQGCEHEIGRFLILRVNERPDCRASKGREIGKTNRSIVEQPRFEHRHVNWCFCCHGLFRVFECKGLGLYGVDISQFRRHWNRSYGVRSALVGFFVSLSIFQREMPTAEHADMWEKGPAKEKLVPCH